MAATMAATQKKTGKAAIIEQSMQDLPPYDIEAEQAILGAILLENAAIYEVMSEYVPGMMYRTTHQKILYGMYELIKEGSAVDLLCLRDKLEHKGYLEECGGPAYIATLILSLIHI